MKSNLLSSSLLLALSFPGIVLSEDAQASKDSVISISLVDRKGDAISEAACSDNWNLVDSCWRSSEPIAPDRDGTIKIPRTPESPFFPPMLVLNTSQTLGAVVQIDSRGHPPESTLALRPLHSVVIALSGFGTDFWAPDGHPNSSVIFELKTGLMRPSIARFQASAAKTSLKLPPGKYLLGVLHGGSVAEHVRIEIADEDNVELETNVSLAPETDDGSQVIGRKVLLVGERAYCMSPQRSRNDLYGKLTYLYIFGDGDVEQTCGHIEWLRDKQRANSARAGSDAQIILIYQGSRDYTTDANNNELSGCEPFATVAQCRLPLLVDRKASISGDLSLTRFPRLIAVGSQGTAIEDISAMLPSGK